jgi:hypothetical protein
LRRLVWSANCPTLYDVTDLYKKIGLFVSAKTKISQMILVELTKKFIMDSAVCGQYPLLCIVPAEWLSLSITHLPTCLFD